MPEIRRARGPDDLARCVQIRTRVFVGEQGVPAERELDGTEAGARAYLAWSGGRPVGTVRWRPLDGGAAAKIERLAVLREARGTGLGAALMRYALAEARAAGARRATLGGQDAARAFYEALGFAAVGEGYLDGGGIPHHTMVRDLRNAQF